jgi:hypothetical protein
MGIQFDLKFHLMGLDSIHELNQMVVEFDSKRLFLDLANVLRETNSLGVEYNCQYNLRHLELDFEFDFRNLGLDHEFDFRSLGLDHEFDFLDMANFLCETNSLDMANNCQHHNGNLE